MTWCIGEELLVQEVNMRLVALMEEVVAGVGYRKEVHKKYSRGKEEL